MRCEKKVSRLLRRAILRRGWHFDCCCPRWLYWNRKYLQWSHPKTSNISHILSDRCSSPNELGSELSSLLCQCGGVLRPEQPTDHASNYRCALTFICSSYLSNSSHWSNSKAEVEESSFKISIQFIWGRRSWLLIWFLYDVMIFLPRCDACEYEEDVWDVRTREEELAALMKSRPCSDVAFMHQLLMTGWETELGFRVVTFGLQDEKVSSSTLPGAGAQVASDHHLGQAGGLATQVTTFPFSSVCIKCSENAHLDPVAGISLMKSWSRKFSFVENIWRQDNSWHHLGDFRYLFES